MDNWNPLRDDFVNPNFNSYNRGPGSNLPRKGLAEDGVQLYVAGIPINLSREALRNLFCQAGRVLNVKILPPKKPEALDTFGFVTMSNLKEATDAITMLNHFQIDRFFLKVQPCQSREERQRQKKRKEEEEAFLMSLNRSKHHSQSGFISNSDSDESFHISRPIVNGVNKGDTKARIGGRGRGILQSDLSLAALDNSIISQGPSTDSVSSRDSLSDLTITVDQQLRQVRKGETASECSYSGEMVRPCGRGITALQQNMTRESNNQNLQSLTNRSLCLQGKIPVSQGGKPCLYCRKKASLLCTRCKMPYCSIYCQKADWPKHRMSCSKISTMPKEINLDVDEFEVSVGEDIVEYLPSGSRTIVKKEYGEKLKASYQNEKQEYEEVKQCPVKQSSSRNKSQKTSPKKGKIYGKNVPTLTQDLKPNQDMKIFIVLATSPEDFIVQIDEPTSKATLDALTNELDKAHEKQKHPLYTPEVGELVSCKYEDGHWYRGSVQYVTNASAIVYFLDFGNVSEIPLMRIRPGLSEHSDYPCQAIQCCLRDVKSVRSINNIKVDDTFSEICLQHGCRFKAKVYGIANSLVILDLYVGKGNNMLDKLTQVVGKGPAINTIPASVIPSEDQEFLCVFTGFISDTEFCVSKFESLPTLTDLHQDITKHCTSTAEVNVLSIKDYVCALFEEGWYRAQVKSVKGEIVSVYFVDYGNSSDVPINDVRTILPEHLKLPCQAIKCSFDGVDASLDHETKNQMTAILQNGPINMKFISSLNGVCKVQVTVQGNNVNECLRQVPNPETDAPGSESTDDSSKNVKIPPPEIPAEGQEMSCIFTGFVTDSEFCVAKLETLKQLMELGENLTKYCNSTAKVSVPAVGDYVCALFEGEWYRAQVKAVQGELLSVYFVDYGNSSDVTINDVRTILPEHLKVPCQAIKCSFDGVDASLDHETKNQMTAILQNSQINIKFISSLIGVCKVQVTVQGNNINECLRQILDPETDAPGSESTEDSSKDVKIPPPEIPADGQEMSCVFTGFVTDSEFCVSKLETLKHLMELGENLTEHCNSTSKVGVPLVRDYVCALFEGEWFRAQVKSMKGEIVSVYFVDYGNSSDVPIKDVRTILPEHLKLPCQAIKCSFDGVDASLDHETKNQMTAILQNGPINIKFISSLIGVCKVQVTVEGNSINECLRQVPNPETDALGSESTEDSSKNVKIPPPEIPAEGQEMSCIFTGFVMDSEFCVAKLETLKQLMELGENLTKYCNRTAKVSVPAIGDYVCALFEGEWYRAQVKAVQGELLSVYFVDYGNSSDVTISDVRTILPEHLKVPCQAIKCSFDGVDASLDQETKNQMTAILKNGPIDIKFISSSNGVCKVQVTVKGNNINECLRQVPNPETDAPGSESTEDSFKDVKIPPPEIPADGQEMSCIFTGFVTDFEFCVSKLETLKQLIELGGNLTKHCNSTAKVSVPAVGDYVCALFEGEWYRAQVKSVKGEIVSVYFVDYGNSSDVHYNDIRAILSEHVKLPCQAIKCSFNGLNYSLDDKQKEEITAILDKNYFTVKYVTRKSDSCEVVIPSISEFINTIFDFVEDKQIPEQDYPKDGSYFDAIVTSCVGDNIFCLLLKDQINGLSKLMEQIAVFCSNTSQSYSAKVGDYVCALFNSDGIWYRAKVVDCKRSGYQVSFIDYGNVDDVDASNIRKLISGLRKFPAQAIVCSLFGVKSIKKEFFEKLMTTHVQVEVVEQVDGINIVKLWLDDGSCVNDIFGENHSEVLPQPSCSIELPSLSIDPTMPLTKHNPVEFEIQHIENMLNFYIQLPHPNCKETLKKIEQELLQCCQAVTPYCPTVQEYVCCFFEGLWYRARVNRVEGDVYIVSLVDYGNEVEVGSDSIRKCKAELASLPPLAYRCCLDRISPDNQDMEKFAEALTSDHCTKIKLIRKENDVHIVEILLSNGQCLNDLLCPDNTSISDSPPTLVKALKRHTVDDLQFIFPLDSELTVIFTFVKDPYNIYCHAASEAGAEAMKKMQEMCSKEMAPYCEKTVMDLEPRVNEVYCGKYIDDWYRCVVLKLCEEKKILVRFLDLGEEREILVHDLRPILPEFLSLPVSVFRCAVYGVKTIGDRWGTGTADLIRSVCNETNQLNVVRRENEILFCDVISCRGVNLRQELIKHCLAEDAVESIDNSADDEDEEEILRQIAELQAKLSKKGKTLKN